MTTAAPARRPLNFDVAGAAAFLGTSTKFIRRRIADGTLKAYRIKGSHLIRIRAEDLEALMRPVTAGASPPLRD